MGVVNLIAFFCRLFRVSLQAWVRLRTGGVPGTGEQQEKCQTESEAKAVRGNSLLASGCYEHCQKHPGSI